MHINQRKILIAGALIAALVLILGGWYLFANSTRPSTDTSTFKSKAFWFDYPRTFDVREFETGAVLVGSQERKEFVPLVQVMEYKSDPDSPLAASYEEFVTQQALELCGSDNSEENVECSNAVVEPFTSLNAFDGFKITLTLTRTNLGTQETVASTFGPIYAFNVTKPATAEDPLRYASVFVNPTLQATLSGTEVTELLDAVVARLVISNEDSQLPL